MQKGTESTYNVDIDLDRLAEQYPDATKELIELTEALNAKQLQRNGAESFLTYVKHMWPDFVEGRHHQIFAEKLERVARGELKRLIINMPPRHTKSEFASTYFPSWILGRNPKLKVMQITHTAELAFRFGRRVRDIIDSPDYQGVFPGVALKADSKSAGRWETNGGGEAFYSGIGGAVTGRGADLLVLDDIHSEQDALSPTALDNAWEYYSSGPRQRLQPGGAIVIVMTRWSTKDLTGRLLSKQVEDHADQWEVVEFPAIFPESGKALWPEYWRLEELQGVKASLPVSKWEAQWMQNPTSFKATTQRFPKKKQRIIRLLLLGACSNLKKAHHDRHYYSWTAKKGGGIFLNSNEWPTISTVIGTPTPLLLKPKPPVCRLLTNCEQRGFL